LKLAINRLLFLFFSSFFLVSFSFAEDIYELDWQYGPKTQSILNKSTIELSKDLVFLNVNETDKFLVYTNNQPLGKEELLMPNNEIWQAYFSFDDVGYIKDDEEIDAENLLKTAQKNDQAQNAYRKEQGWSSLITVGWEYPPRYNTVDKRLEWAYLVKDENTDELIINYHTRILGRNGVIGVQLATFPEDLNDSVNELSLALDSFKYNSGERYSEYQKGDRVAEFGLAALIAGGAAAVASKKGLWAVIGGLLVAAKKFAFAIVIALFAGIVSIFRRKK
jgi:uncharacterized membrane-anchored protein